MQTLLINPNVHFIQCRSPNIQKHYFIIERFSFLYDCRRGRVGSDDEAISPQGLTKRHGFVREEERSAKPLILRTENVIRHLLLRRACTCPAAFCPTINELWSMWSASTLWMGQWLFNSSRCSMNWDLVSERLMNTLYQLKQKLLVVQIYENKQIFPLQHCGIFQQNWF